MRRVEVEVRDDIGHHEGGQAVILVTGLDHLDDGVTFFLRPLDAVTQEAGLGALDNEQRALSVRSVAGGVELVVGPDVTEHPALVAGSSVEIEIPEAGVWSEFQWPVVSARTRPRRTKIVANRPPLGEPAFELRTAPAAGRERREPPGLDDVLRGARASEARPAAQKTTGPVQEEATAMTTTQPAEKVPQSISDGPVDDPSHAEAQEFVVFYPYARGGKLGATATGPASERRVASLLPTTRLGAAATAVAAVLALQGLLWLGSREPTASALSSTQASVSTAGESSMFELFSVGPVSPRGVQARDYNATKSLENAQAALLTPGGARDAEEASYWLRRFIGSSGSDERTRRVLTQLGTTFADASNRQPEFGKARQVWELASAFGDPVAMCFLGTLHENGLGVPPDRRAALQWYERAKQTGGCPSLDESIARVKK